MNKESSEWISVEDRLPQKDEYCLVYGKSIGVLIRPFNEFHQCWDDEDADDYFTDAKGGKITHWQLLPTKL